MMKKPDHDVDRELRSLADDGWNDSAHQNQLEKELTHMHFTRYGRARRRRLRTLTLGLLLLLIGGGGTGGTYAWMNTVHKYTFEVRRGDEMLGRPTVIVRRGQTAGVIVGSREDDPDAIEVYIHFDGSYTLVGPPDAVWDVEVVEIEIDQ